MNPNNTRQNSLLDAMRGPIMLVALGLLMAADQMDRYSIDRTWPALLILFGLLKVASYMSGREDSTGGDQR
jgi:hypothetical protein